MSGKRLWVAVSLLVALGLLVACAPAAAPTPKATPTVIPYGTPTPAPPTPTRVAPTVAPGAPTPPAATPTKVAVTTPVAAPQYGGTLLLCTGADPRSLDFHQDESEMEIMQLGSFYSQLMQFDPQKNDQIFPDLAEKWEVSPDGKTFTFSLRKGVKWHDGKPFTSADAVYTFNRALNPPKGVRMPRWGDILALGITKLEAPDDSTFKITLAEPKVAALSALAMGWVGIFPKHKEGKEGERPLVGTGAFKFQRYERSISMEGTKNPDYFIKGRPYLDGITVYIIPDPGTRLAALKTKRVHVTPTFPDIRPREAELLQKELGDKVRIAIFPTNSIYPFIFNAQKKPWDDVRVRKAFYLAIDRQGLIKLVLEGNAVPSAGIVDPRSGWGLTLEEVEKLPGVRQPKDKDIAEAKRLLAEAGIKPGFKYEIKVRSVGEYPDVVTFIKDQLERDLGIVASLQVMESAAGFAAFLRGDFETCMQGTGFNFPDPDGGLGMLYLPEAGRNYGKWRNDKFVELFKKESVTFDRAARDKLIREMQTILQEDMPLVPLGSTSHYVVLWADVKDYPNRVGHYNSHHYDTVWLAK